MITDNLTIFMAPMQGFTDAGYRSAHARLTGGVDTYCAPFVHLEHGEPRRRDIRDIAPEVNQGLTLLPQVLFRNVEELAVLTDAVTAQGYSHIDLNLGCPFPPQMKRGRGCGLLGRPEVMEDVARFVASRPELTFSVKMRLGADDPDQWKTIMPVINSMALKHVTIHPRIGIQQYGGELYMDSLTEFASRLHHPLVYNGDISTVGGALDIAAKLPGLSGIMIGRGLLARPTLASEIKSALSGEQRPTPTDAEEIAVLLDLHDEIYQQYTATLCGDAQLLSKIKPFWEYAGALLPHKAAKAIRKAGSVRNYERAVNDLRFYKG